MFDLWMFCFFNLCCCCPIESKNQDDHQENQNDEPIPSLQCPFQFFSYDCLDWCCCWWWIHDNFSIFNRSLHFLHFHSDAWMERTLAFIVTITFFVDNLTNDLDWNKLFLNFNVCWFCDHEKEMISSKWLTCSLVNLYMFVADNTIWSEIFTLRTTVEFFCRIILHLVFFLMKIQ